MSDIFRLIKICFLLGCAAVLNLTGVAFAGGESVFFLQDGSTIQGELISFKDGYFEIRSKSIGSVKLHQSKIKNITGGSSSGGKKIDFDKIKKQNPDQVIGQMGRDYNLSDNDFEKIGKTMSNPEVRKLLSDPELMKMIQSGNSEGLMDHPGMKKLMENPDFQKLKGDLGVQ
jgi:hypothetical protein